MNWTYRTRSLFINASPPINEWINKWVCWGQLLSPIGLQGQCICQTECFSESVQTIPVLFPVEWMSESDEMIVGIEMEVIDKFELTVSWARSLNLNTKPSPHQYFLRWMRNSRLELPVFTCSVSTELVVNGKLTYFPFWRCLTVMVEVLGHGQMCMELFHSSRFKWFCSWENGTDIKVTKHFVQITPSTFGRKCR